MAELHTTKGSQYPLVAEFAIDVMNDTMKDTAGTVQNFYDKASSAFTVDIANVPVGAIITGGFITANGLTVSGSGTYKLKLGDDDNATRYIAQNDYASTAYKSVTPTGYVTDGSGIRMEVDIATGNATAGKIYVAVEYIINGRINEAQTY